MRITTVKYRRHGSTTVALANCSTSHTGLYRVKYRSRNNRQERINTVNSNLKILRSDLMPITNRMRTRAVRCGGEINIGWKITSKVKLQKIMIRGSATRIITWQRNEWKMLAITINQWPMIAVIALNTQICSAPMRNRRPDERVRTSGWTSDEECSVRLTYQTGDQALRTEHALL